MPELRGWLFRRLFLLYEWLKAFQETAAAGTENAGSLAAPNGQALPPPGLRMKVAGTANVQVFLEGGERGMQCIREALAAAGSSVDECRTVLDFGCGCGRVLLHWKTGDGVALFGSDLNPELIDWCDEYLPSVHATVNPLDPPTSFAVDQFDLVYAFSVFTHLPEALQKQWLQEFERIVKPGGLLIFSTHGKYYEFKLTDKERRRFADGDCVVRFESASGSNLCNTYHPESFVRETLARNWEVAAFLPEGALGNPRQDVWVFRRKPRSVMSDPL